MTQRALPETVIAPFDSGEALHYQGRRFELERRGDEFFVEMRDPAKNFPLERVGREFWEVVPEDAERIQRKVVMTTGSHHYQLFHYETGQSRRVDLFPFVWRIDEQMWMSLHSAFLLPPDLRQGMAARWNESCNRCHATQAEPNITSDVEMDTQVKEFGIACESCHGPGEEHVRANQAPQRRYSQHFSDRPDPTIVNPRRLSAKLGSHVCAQCHGSLNYRSNADYAEWQKGGFTYRPGDDLGKTRLIRNLGESTFWWDGMIRVSGREYNGLLRSPCFAHGESEKQLSCLDCHELHLSEDDPRPTSDWTDDQLGSGMRGNAACTQCHSALEDEQELTRHTRHAAGSTGSKCYNCHMPNTAYGLLKATRGHEIEIPGVAKSIYSGRPNGCNLCHLDRTLQWTDENLTHWYGPQPEVRRGRGLSEDEATVAASVLWLLSGDAGQRALIAWGMGWPPAKEISGTRWMAPFLAQLLEDPYAAVRFIAYQTIRNEPGFADFANESQRPPLERSAKVREALDIWRSGREANSGGELSHGSAVLIDESGDIQWSRFKRLLAKRDETRVELAE
jgi:hypothetical protein